MKQSNITLTEFKDAFRRLGRNESFSYEGFSALYDYLEELDTGSEIELDPIAFDCAFAEYSKDELWNHYGQHIEGIEDYQSLIEYLQENTTLIEVENGNYIVEEF